MTEARMTSEDAVALRYTMLSLLRLPEDFIERILATYAECERLTAENANWRDAVAKVTLAPSTEDVSTPAAFLRAEAIHAAGLILACDELRAENARLLEQSGRASEEVLSLDLNLDVAREECERLREDGARVDWAESNVCKMTCRRANGSEYVLEWESNGPDADTARSTLDTARSARASETL